MPDLPSPPTEAVDTVWINQPSSPSANDADRQLIWNLRRMLSDRVDENSDLMHRYGAAIEAIDIIGAELLEEATNRDWCVEFDRFVDRVNDRIPSSAHHLSTRDVEWHGTIVYTMKVQVNLAAPTKDEALAKLQKIYMAIDEPDLCNRLDSMIQQQTNHLTLGHFVIDTVLDYEDEDEIEEVYG
jgi:hypothetical protein